MCGRMSLAVSQAVLEERFSAVSPRELQPRYNIRPGDDLVVIRNDVPEQLDLLHWGLLPAWVDDPTDYHYPINARAESLPETAAFRDAYADRRCLVLADGFFEWSGHPGRKQPHRIVRTDGQPFAMAGLWERWTDGERTRSTAAVVTTRANDTIKPIHDRMPVILEPGQESIWLDGSPEDRSAVTEPCAPDLLRSYPVSTAVNDPANDDPSVIAPLGDEQTNFGDFGS